MLQSAFVHHHIIKEFLLTTKSPYLKSNPPEWNWTPSSLRHCLLKGWKLLPTKQAIQDSLFQRRYTFQFATLLPHSKNFQHLHEPDERAERKHFILENIKNITEVILLSKSLQSQDNYKMGSNILEVSSCLGEKQLFPCHLYWLLLD